MPFVDVRGVKLSYELHGEGPPFVLSCGLGQPAATWAMTGDVQRLVDLGCQVVTYDHRGMPPSDAPPRPYTVEEMAEDLIGLLDHLDNGPYVVQGYSLGGLVAQTVALRRPDLLPAVMPAAQLADRGALEAAMAMMTPFIDSLTDGLIGQYEACVSWDGQHRLDELADLKVPALAITGELELSFPPAEARAAVVSMPAVSSWWSRERRIRAHSCHLMPKWLRTRL